MTSSPSLFVDVAIVGGSAAGLAAALQLARQERTVAVLDDGTPRNAPASHLHGFLGFDGRPPAELIAAARAEVEAYGVHLVADRVADVHGAVESGFIVLRGDGSTIGARRLIAATGLIDLLPTIEGLAERWGDSVIHCPFCHGYEHRGKVHVHLATMPMSLHPAPLFAHLARTLTVVVTPDAGVDDAALDELRAVGVEVLVEGVQQVAGEGAGVTGVELANGRRLEAEVVSITPMVQPRVGPFVSLGLEGEPHPMGIGGHVPTDPTGQTSVAGLYAAGNVTDPSHQLLSAAADGARVGAMVAFDLAGSD